MVTIIVNSERRAVQSPPDTPLLYVLRNELNLLTAKFGCGLAQCGPVQSCWTVRRSVPALGSSTRS
ncbi:hypothetical protein E3H11_41790 [Bradyrhizobium brasilense]|nr:hypothetical protein [Bradyrhizobium brasilense]